MRDEQKTKAQLIQELTVLRRQIARLEAIGDSMNQTLYGMNLYADAATKRLASGDVTLATDYLKDLQETTQSLLRTVRLLAHHLCPASLEDGLVAALREQLACVEQALGIDAELDVVGTWPCMPDVDKSLSQIVQEILDQVLKDGQARRIRLRLQREAQISSIELCVDGAGFCAEDTVGGGPQQEMTEQPLRLGGKLHVTGHSDHGATIRVEFPHESAS